MAKDLNLSLMLGLDIPIPELALIVHPPKLREIALMGQQDFFRAIQYLCVNKESLIQDESLLKSLSNFQVLMKVLHQSNNSENKKIIQNLLKLLFPEYNATILPSSVILSGEGKDVVAIDDNNFAFLQEYLKEILCVHNLFQGDNIIYNPRGAKAKAIADKLMRYRKKVAEINSNKQSQDILTRYVSILVIGTNNIDVNSCKELNLFQLFDLMERYSAFVEWDIDLRVRLAGGKPDNKVETWMRDLYNQETSTSFTEKDPITVNK